MRSRRLAAVLLTSIGLVAAVPSAAPAAHHGPVASAACMNVVIEGQSKCIARGQFCKKAWERYYRRYGLSCSNRDANGNWHLT